MMQNTRNTRKRYDSAASSVVVNRVDKETFEKIRDQFEQQVGFKLSFRQAFGILINNVTADDILETMTKRGNLEQL